jgi:hypothetical protein
MLSWRDRQNIREQEVFRAKLNFVKRKRFSFNFSIILSLVALIISGLAFYLTNFYINRTLSVAITPEPPVWTLEFEDKPLEFTPVVLNSGNRSETILGAYLSIETDLGAAKGEISQGPLVIKPGDSVVVKVGLKAPPKEIKKYTSEADINLVIQALSPSGSSQQHSFALAHMTFDEGKGYCWERSKNYPGSVVTIFHETSDSSLISLFSGLREVKSSNAVPTNSASRCREIVGESKNHPSSPSK